MVKKNLQQLLEKRMTRKKFIATSGMMALTVLGVTGTLKKITELPQAENTTPKSNGFGSSPYGK
ncbi:MAG TPA: hypothetical protein VM077_01980 [Candidatus Limnocylindrales bacterium]|nr:hypothetical protein [Candidatus Limnocylindrales bacterium]